MIRTLHHMADPAAALARVRSALSPRAVFVLEYPNKRNLKAILRWLARRQDWNPFRPDPVEFARLNFDFHPRAVRTWLGQADFDVEREVPVSFLRLPGLKQVLPLTVLGLIESLLQRLGRWGLVTPSVFVRARAVGETGSKAQGFWRCPACGSLDVHESDSGIDCRGCGSRWPRREGIYEFRPRNG
jgi:ribosomal protein L37AE/L43A